MIVPLYNLSLNVFIFSLDSPFIKDSSTDSFPSIIFPSADTLSPDSRIIISPFTTSFIFISSTFFSRNTFVLIVYASF